MGMKEENYGETANIDGLCAAWYYDNNEFNSTLSNDRSGEMDIR